MSRQIAFLRGINISGKNRVPMAELKACFEGLGFAASELIGPARRRRQLVVRRPYGKDAVQ